MTDIDQTFIDDLPATPAGRAAQWILRHLAAGGQHVTAEEMETWIGWKRPDGGDPHLDDLRRGLAGNLEQVGGQLRFDGLVTATEHEIGVRFLDAAGRASEYMVQVDTAPPHRISGAWLQRALPPGMEVRLARPQDGPALRKVAAGAPLRLGDVTVTIDPGEDYFAGCRLMGEHVYTYVATDAGKPVGIHCGVSYPVRFTGREGRFFLIAHSRLLPRYEGRGVWGRLNSVMFGHFFGSSLSHISGVAYVRPENAAAQRLSGAQARWSVRPFRAVLDCRALAADDAGRPATPADATRIVELLNRCHDAEELFMPYTEATLAERLGRAPELYAWRDVLVSERAAVGVWRSGEVRELRPDSGPSTTQRRAAVLDYGFERGAEDELAALLRAWCARLSSDGFTHLGIFSSPASPGNELLRGLASDIEEYDIMPPGLDEPPTTATHGIYVDPVYF